MNVEKLIDDLESEIKYLQQDLPNVIYKESARAIHDAIDNRVRAIGKLHIKYPQYIKKG